VTQHPNELRQDEALQTQGQAEGKDQGYGNDSKRSEIFHTFPDDPREPTDHCDNPLLILEEHSGNQSVNRVTLAGIAGERP
jgi:hypothetical protein